MTCTVEKIFFYLSGGQQNFTLLLPPRYSKSKKIWDCKEKSMHSHTFELVYICPHLFLIVPLWFCLTPFHFLSQRGQRKGKEDASERGGGLFSLRLSLPSLSATYRARLQDDRPNQHTHHPAEGVQGHGGAGTLGELQAPEAWRLLLQAEAQLLEGRDRHKLANRIQVQEMIGRLQELVLIPP